MHAPELADDVAEARRLGGLRRRREVALTGAYDLDGISGPMDVLRIVEIAAIDALALDNSPARSRTLAQLARVALHALDAVVSDDEVRALLEIVRRRRVRGREMGGEERR